MRLRNFFVGTAMLSFLGAGMIAIADDAATKPSPAMVKPNTRIKIPMPFVELKDLTDDQKAKILDVHATADEQIKEIMKKEHDDIMALLTDDQKQELTTMAAQQALARKAEAAERRAKEEAEKAAKLNAQAGAATQP